MLIWELRELFRNSLNIKREESDTYFYLLLKYFLKLPKYSLALDPKKSVNSQTTKLFLDSLERLKNEEPIQYIIGKVDFMGLSILVNSSVLIPRPETEEMVALATKSLSLTKGSKILDIGTGSGCICIALAKHFTESFVSAIEISKEALQVAQRNAFYNQVEIEFINMDIFQYESPKNYFDLIVSNPPYVKKSEKSQMSNNVLLYEPSKALFVSDERPLIFYEAILKIAALSLTNGGQLYFEINETQAEQVKDLMESFGFQSIRITKDFQGKERILDGRWSS